MEITNLQKQVDEWIKTIGVRYFNELTNMAILTEEVGEVARIIARRYGEQSEKESDKNKDLGEELADVLFVTLCLANQTGIDLQKSFDKKMDKKTERDRERHQNNTKLISKIPKCEMLDDKTIHIKGSKSETNRLLVLQKLFENITLQNTSTSQDSEVLIKAFATEDEIIDIHHAGTAMRFLTSYFAIQSGRKVILTGSERMKQRPIKPLVDALIQLGADIIYVENEGFPPLAIQGKILEKNEVNIPANISSQFITSLMLIGAKLPNGIKITLEGKITSLPYLMMTLQLLKEVGIEAELDDHVVTVKPISGISGIHHTVESDWSSASYYYSLAAIGRKRITLTSFKENSLQADSRMMEIYKEFFGVDSVFKGDASIELIPQTDFKFPEKIVLNMNDCPDTAQTLAVTASALKIPFKITGLETLKIKETDRLVALQNELAKFGVKTEITDESIESVSFGEYDQNIIIKTYNDHRMAMAFAPFALKKEIEIENPEVVEKSYPEFWLDFHKIVQS